MMRTTIYINTIHAQKLKVAASLLNISKNEIISILISRLTHDNRFDSSIFKAVEYQKSDPDIIWKIEHIDFEPVFYEKALDLRRNYKFSVSWFIAYGILNYLDEIVENLLNPENKRKIEDNYDRNYVYIHRKLGNIPAFIAIWGIPKEKHIKKSK
jgi:hypothetical protein